MIDAWERMCEAVGATAETVLLGYRIMDAGFAPEPLLVLAPWPDYTATLTFAEPDPPAYLRKPNRKRWRGVIRAALGPQWARSWRYWQTKNLGRDWPHVGYVEHLRKQHEIIQHGNLRDLFSATPATGGQSAGDTRAKEGRSNQRWHGDGR